MTSARWATFDCFGTLVDWRHGIATSAELLFPGRGAELLAGYQRHEHQVERENPGMRYRVVLAETLRRACQDAGLTLRDDDAGILGDTLPYWPVFPEVPSALRELRESGWRLALLTNCDTDLIAHSLRRLGAPIDAVVTAEAVGSYKPVHRHFTRFAESFGIDQLSIEPARGVDQGRWVHVAQSYFHDIRPASELGIRRVWINRLGDPDDESLADAVLSDLTGLAQTLDAI
jgi:2-haloacid dehalogenase